MTAPMVDSESKVPKITTRRFLIGVLIVLIGMLAILAYLYYSFTKPIGLARYSTGEYKPLLSIYGKSSKPDDLLKRPNDVAFDRFGDVYVTDSENARVFVFDSRGRFLRQIGKRGTGKGEFQVPIGIAVAKDGTTYVADKILNKVSVFDKNGTPKKDIPVAHPMKPLVAGAHLYVTTAWNVNIYNLEGRELTKFGRKGKARGEFSFPFGIAVDSAGSIFVAEPANLRVQAFKKNGEVSWVKGKSPRDVYGQGREFGLPAGLALGSDDRLYLVDAFYHRIYVLTKDGKTIRTFGQQGTREGELNYPAGIASRGDGVFAIADKYNDRVQIIKIKVEG